MAFPTKDGKSFGSRFKQRKYDSVHAEKMDSGKVGEGFKGTNSPKPSEPKEMSRVDSKGEALDTRQEQSVPDNNPKGMNMAEGSPQPSAIVAKHGKATHVHTSHDHEGGKHHVHSVHADGHVHDSDHASQADAHEAATTLGGGDQSEFLADENAPEPDGFQMPRLA